MKHIYECQYLNKEKPDIQCEPIFNGTIYEQKKVSRRFERNKIIRQILKETNPNHVILN